MTTYKQLKNSINNIVINNQIYCINSDSFIPFDPANTDYAQFKKAISEGAELLDADGETMTAEQVAELVSTLP
jgi:hypothetical protein